MESSIPKEKVLEAYNNAPDEVRATFNSSDTTTVIDDIRNTYKLHIDIAGTLGKNVGYMLLGLMSPAEFFGQMVLAGVNEAEARKVLETLNSRVFIPLSNRMKNTAAAVPAPESAVQEPAPVKRPPVVPPPAVTMQPAPVAEKMPEPQIPSYNIIQRGPVAPSAVQAQHATPAQSFQTASIPVSIPHQAPSPVPVEVIKTPAPPTPNSATQAEIPPAAKPLVREYGNDPYREPIS